MKKALLSFALIAASSTFAVTFQASAASFDRADEASTEMDSGESDRSFAAQARTALNRDVKCSSDGRLCLECYYKPNGDLLYCDVWILPARATTVFSQSEPLKDKTRALSTRSAVLPPSEALI